MNAFEKLRTEGGFLALGLVAVAAARMGVIDGEALRALLIGLAVAGVMSAVRPAFPVAMRGPRP